MSAAQNQSILECQKSNNCTNSYPFFLDAVIKMLSLADKQDLDDEDDDLEPKSVKQKKSMTQQHKHIKTGADLGATLTQRKIQRWKVLILDSYTKHLLQPLLNVGDLRALGVTLIMFVFICLTQFFCRNVKDIRQSIPDAPAIYFVQPTKENIDVLCKDCAQDLYETSYVNFASSISRPLLEDMAKQLVASESTNKVSRVCHVSHYV